jgi:hypothetical protein
MRIYSLARRFFQRINWQLMGVIVLILVSHSIVAANDVAHPQRDDRTGPSYEGQMTAVDITPDGRTTLAYYDMVNKDLILAVFPNSNVLNTTKTTIDSTGAVGKYVSIVAVSNTAVVMSYQDSDNGTLKVARCALPCTSPTIATIRDTDDGFAIGYRSTIRVNSSGNPVIVHTDAAGHYVYLTTCTDAVCRTSTNTHLARDPMPDERLGLALTSTGNPVVAYQSNADGNPANGSLQLVICSDSACASKTNTLIDENGSPGASVDLELDSSNIPMMSYLDATSTELRYARCNNTACGTVTIVGSAKFKLNGSATSLELHTTSRGVVQPVIAVAEAAGSSYPTTVSLVTCATVSCTTVTTANISSLDTGYGLSMRVRGNTTVVGFFYLDGTVYTYIDPAYPIGTSASNMTYLVHIGSPPSPFSKTTPLNNTMNKPGNIMLTWEYMGDTENFEFCYYPSSSSCASWTTLYQPKATIAAWSTGDYLWQVRAVNRAGKTTANKGTPWALRIVTPTLGSPNPFNRLSPTNTATGVSRTARLTWGVSSNATSYEYCISTTTTCTNWVNVGNVQAVTTPRLLSMTTYYWQVRAKNSARTTNANGGMWKFTTGR